MRYVLALFYGCVGMYAHAQQGYISGMVQDTTAQPVSYAHITLGDSSYSGGYTGVYTDPHGRFFLTLPAPAPYVLQVSYVGKEPLQRRVFVSPYDTLYPVFTMEEKTYVLAPIHISPKRDTSPPLEAGRILLDTKDLEGFPAIDTDISQVLSTLPGVVSYNSFSNAYSVRGGSSQENLVYIEDIPVYTPYLVRSGQQQSLNFANIALAQELSFSAGGWQSRYGDKLSSILNVKYKRPVRTKTSATLSFLGAHGHLEAASPSQRWQLLTALRYKNTRYLFGNLDTKGEYFPVFFDTQAMLRIRLRDKDALPSSLILLGGYARNRYELIPEFRKSTFGTIDRQFAFHAFLEGKEQLSNDVVHTGAKWTHALSEQFSFSLLSTLAFSWEREYLELNTAYRLCDLALENEECQVDRGVAEQLDYARNFLVGRFSFFQAQGEWKLNTRHRLETGTFLQVDAAEGRVREYGLEDREGYIEATHRAQNDDVLTRYLVGGFFQHSYAPADGPFHWTTGVRWNYVDLSEEWLLSPSLQMSFQRTPYAPTRYTLSAGLYRQFPFYREMRDRFGRLHKDLRAESAVHVLGGVEHQFYLFGRYFKWYSEAYYKYFPRLIAFEQEGIRTRYDPETLSSGYAYGVDMRVYGFFVPQYESWLSISYLNSAEDFPADGRGYIRRPTDQRFSVGLFLQDYLPHWPTWQAHLKMLYGTGLPFNPSGEHHLRNVFEGQSYLNFDVGFSKRFDFAKKRPGFRVKHVWLAFEIINLLGFAQNISYTWIEAHDGQFFAIPNNFSARLFNAKLRVAME